MIVLPESQALIIWSDVVIAALILMKHINNLEVDSCEDPHL